MSPLDPGQLAALQALVGAPYDARDRRPGFHCWGLFREVQRILFEVDLPEVDIAEMSVRARARAFTTAPERRRWQRIAAPRHGCAVLLGRRDVPIHIGCYLELGPLPCDRGVIHAARPAVSFDSLAHLEFAGWRMIACLERACPERT
ncbi:MAG: hypothetical protein CMN87_14635 [Stappia sp.]|uniref:hypothetical protein n=1 Tax=Stappia sp. TaxID=1870903 RepID=UPI000C35F397|nr:hypothetical protein [Stappia sp.]MAA99972.1 hypothetical protein [Stappia sp.]MBM21243.1 hypothetical protein [Stappia sp.]